MVFFRAQAPDLEFQSSSRLGKVVAALTIRRLAVMQALAVPAAAAAVVAATRVRMLLRRGC